MTDPLPTAADVDDAAVFLRGHLAPTPLVPCPALSERLGCDYRVKLESAQPTGAFKVRGGANLVGRLTPAERAAGVIGASTGNHGQSLAWAGRRFGVSVVVYAPAVGANPAKLEAMARLGAEVRQHGRDFDEARLEVERVARREGRRYVHSGDEPLLIAGVGTMGLEILAAAPETDVILVAVGGGSGAAGICLAAARHPGVEVIGVQSARAPAAHRAWAARRLDLAADMATVHEGLATRTPFALPQRILWERLHDFVLVDDGEIDAAIRLLAAEAHLVAEGAGAAALAGALRLRDRLAGRVVVGVLSGANVPLPRYASTLAGGALPLMETSDAAWARRDEKA